MNDYNVLELKEEPFYEDNDELNELRLINIYVDGQFLQDKITQTAGLEPTEITGVAGLQAHELYDSLKMPHQNDDNALGAAPLFTCDFCHSDNCWFFGVKVKEKTDKVIWESFTQGFIPHNKVYKVPLVFEKSRYLAELAKLKYLAEREIPYIGGTTFIRVYKPSGEQVELGKFKNNYREGFNYLHSYLEGRDTSDFPEVYMQHLSASEFVWALQFKKAIGEEFVVAYGPLRLEAPVPVRLVPGDIHNCFSPVNTVLSRHCCESLSKMFCEDFTYLRDELNDLYEEVDLWAWYSERWAKEDGDLLLQKGNALAGFINRVFTGAVCSTFPNIFAHGVLDISDYRTWSLTFCLENFSKLAVL